MGCVLVGWVGLDGRPETHPQTSLPSRRSLHWLWPFLPCPLAWALSLISSTGSVAHFPFPLSFISLLFISHSHPSYPPVINREPIPLSPLHASIVRPSGSRRRQPSRCLASFKSSAASCCCCLSSEHPPWVSLWACPSSLPITRRPKLRQCVSASESVRVLVHPHSVSACVRPSYLASSPGPDPRLASPLVLLKRLGLKVRISSFEISPLVSPVTKFLGEYHI